MKNRTKNILQCVVGGLLIVGLACTISIKAEADTPKIGREYREVSQTEYKIEFETSRGDFCVGFASIYSSSAVALTCDFSEGKK